MRTHEQERRSVRLPEGWIVDLLGQAIERHTGPSGDHYRHTERVGKGEALAPLALPELSLRVDNVLG